MSEIRLFFEPKHGTNVNHDEMFEHYTSNWLDGFDVEFGGNIAMNAVDKVLGKLEPVYQYILREPSYACLEYLDEYINRNPLHGYYIHMYVRNIELGISQHFKVYGS